MQNKFGRKIDIDALMNAENKVTIGCKCNPSLKLALINEAKDMDCSLSEYVELTLENRKLRNYILIDATSKMP
jgi:hypothetical protein